MFLELKNQKKQPGKIQGNFFLNLITDLRLLIVKLANSKCYWKLFRIASRPFRCPNDCMPICCKIKNHAAQRTASPSNDLRDIPKKAICTWGANLLAIPKNISVINIAMIDGADNWIPIDTIFPTSPQTLCQKAAWKVKKYNGSILSMGIIV